MKKIIEIVSNEVMQAFENAGYDGKLGVVTWSNRPDLCEFQCNGSMAGAKQYKKAPIVIANEVVSFIGDSEVIDEVSVVPPGFININIGKKYLVDYISEMVVSPKFGQEEGCTEKIVVDYGGPNVAKPLHVGHLRSAIIGESIKRIARYIGYNVVGDIHLGDWGLQIGQIIAELEERNPKLPYFDESFTGDYPVEAPFTISELEEIYPCASGKSKVDVEFKAKAMEATVRVQNADRGYYALWNHIINVSKADLRKNYDKLDVHFDLWNGESSVQPLIPDMVKYLKDNDYAHISDGALVVDVVRKDDNKEIPPCMILKSDGASLYNTTDLATMIDRMNTIKPNQMIYVVDKRQDLYFEQVFRCAKKTKLVNEDTKLDFLGFGTMNGKDGKPFKTRDGGVMRLEYLLDDIKEQMYKKIKENKADISEDEANEIAGIVSLAAVKYGDLSNQASKDYIFDIDKFISFEGDTGPYILYTIVRIKSILRKYSDLGCNVENDNFMEPLSVTEKSLMLEITKCNAVIASAFDELAPHKLCSYIYDLANASNKFYHETKIISEEDVKRRGSYCKLLMLTKSVLEVCIDLLGFSAPEKM